MTILHIALACPFDEEMSYQENLLSKYNARDGHVVILLTTCYKWDNSGRMIYTPPEDRLMGDGVRLVRMNYHRIINEYITLKIRKVDGVYNFIEQIAPEIIFFHGPQTVELLTIVKYIQAFPRTRLFIDNHADFSNSATNYISLRILHKGLWRYVAKKAEPYTARFYGVLPSRVSFLINIYKIDKKNCELLLMGADDDKVRLARESNPRSKIRLKLGISNNDFLIVTGGKIDESKAQILLLLQAVKSLNAPNVKLIIFGSIISKLKKQVLSFVDNTNIFYLGWLNTDQIYSYFAASDLAAFPGRHSVLWEEAVGFGIPCIFKYWDETTHIDVGGNCRFLFDDRADEIKLVLEEIINNPDEFDKMKTVASQIGVNKFSYQQISRRAVQSAT